MSENKIHIIGDNEIISMLGLLGTEGTIITEITDFMKEFNKLINNSSISMIIIAMNLPENLIDFLIDFKLNRRKPFLFYLPDLFSMSDDNKDIFISKIYESLGKLLI
ncbi:MAG: V-type ATP synthase subunit F [Promethearchaeota archaeon]